MPLALLADMTKQSKLTAVLVASTLTLIGLGQAACISDENSVGLPPFEEPAWVSDKTKFAEDWIVSGYEGSHAFCKDGKAKSPRIIQIITTGQTGLNTRLYALIAGCTSDNKVNYHGFIEGEVIEDASEPNTWFVSGRAGVWAKLADGTEALAEDPNAVWAIDVTERNTACRERDGYSVETATLDVSLRAPGANYNTERLLRQLRPSTLDGTRYTSCE